MCADAAFTPDEESVRQHINIVDKVTKRPPPLSLWYGPWVPNTGTP